MIKWDSEEVEQMFYDVLDEIRKAKRCHELGDENIGKIREMAISIGKAEKLMDKILSVFIVAVEKDIKVMEKDYYGGSNVSGRDIIDSISIAKGYERCH